MPQPEYDDNWTDVYRIPVDHRPPLRHESTDSEPSQSASPEIPDPRQLDEEGEDSEPSQYASPEIPDPDEEGEKVYDDGLSFSSIVMVGLILGILSGYIFPDMINWRGHHVMDPFTSRLEKVSWEKDGHICNAVVEDLDKSVLGFEETAKNITKHAHDLVNREQHLPAVLTHYAALSLILRDSVKDRDSDQQNNLQQDILNCFFRAKQALRPIHSQIFAGAKSRLPCTTSLWKLFIEKIITVHVSYKDDEVFKEVWSKISEAITDAELQMWFNTKTRAEEAVNIMKETFGKDAYKYEAFGWSMRIAGIAFDKIGQHGKGRLLLADAEIALKTAKDKVSHFDFSKTMFRLFPHDSPLYANHRYMWYVDGLEEEWKMHYV